MSATHHGASSVTCSRVVAQCCLYLHIQLVTSLIHSNIFSLVLVLLTLRVPQSAPLPSHLAPSSTYLLLKGPAWNKEQVKDCAGWLGGGSMVAAAAQRAAVLRCFTQHNKFELALAYSHYQHLPSSCRDSHFFSLTWGLCLARSVPC